MHMFKVGDKVRVTLECSIIKRFGQIGIIQENVWSECFIAEWLVKFEDNPYNRGNSDDFLDAFNEDELELINEN